MHSSVSQAYAEFRAALRDFFFSVTLFLVTVAAMWAIWRGVAPTYFTFMPTAWQTVAYWDLVGMAFIALTVIHVFKDD